MTHHAADWCILQMSGPRTLAVVRSLRSVGFDVWAPTGMKRLKRPRSSKYRDRPTALLTCFAFAPYDDAPALGAIAASPEQDHPAFTVLMVNDVYGKVADRDLDGLRQHEADAAEEWTEFVAAEEQARLERIRKKKGRRKEKGRLNAARSYVLGQTVRVPTPAFQGLTAKIVENRRNGELVIEFEGMSLGKMTVEACGVKPVHVDGAKPEQAPVT